MKVFLDTSVVLAACLSEAGASREIWHLAKRQRWQLLISPWILRETRKNLIGKSLVYSQSWDVLRTSLNVTDDQLVFDWPVIFQASKDKPVLCSALACADILLTLDRRDFRELLGTTIYGLRVLTPGEFLRGEREAGRLLLKSE